MKVCLSIAPESSATARNFTRKLPKGVDLIELRTDRMDHPDIAQLLRRPHPPLIVTNRSILEGGYFSGDDDDHKLLLREICSYQPEYVDIEWRHGSKFYGEFVRKFPKTTFILSYHDTNGTADSLLPLYRKMRTAKPAIIKIVTAASSLTDNIPILALLAQAAKDKQPIITFCMGEYGQPTRIAGGMYGAFLTFGSHETLPQTAPGQFAATDLAKLFRAQSMNNKTRLFGLVGNPVSQSRGVVFHNERFGKQKLNARYVNFLADSFDEFMDVYGKQVAGISVTMPFKADAAAIATRRSDASHGLPIVNTILFTGKTRIGYNTDLSAIIQLVKSRGGFNKKRVTIAGTGGVAEAMIFAAVKGGGTVTIGGRNAEKRNLLAERYGCVSVPLEDIALIPADILMNGTPLGMKGQSQGVLLPPRALKKVGLVFDAVASPAETGLVIAARKAGCATITGKDLFLTQAELQSKLFCSMV